MVEKLQACLDILRFICDMGSDKHVDLCCRGVRCRERAVSCCGTGRAYLSGEEDCKVSLSELRVEGINSFFLLSFFISKSVCMIITGRTSPREFLEQIVFPFSS